MDAENTEALEMLAGLAHAQDFHVQKTGLNVLVQTELVVWVSTRSYDAVVGGWRRGCITHNCTILYASRF